MSRADYGRTGLNFKNIPDGLVQLDVDKVKILEWRLPAAWDSGPGFRSPLKPIGKQSVMLTSGEHQLIVRFDGRAKSPHTFFGGFTFTRTHGER